MDIIIAIFHALGDCVNSTTLLKPLRAKYPDTPIKWLTSNAYKSVAQNNPYINEIITFDDPPNYCDRRYPEIKSKYKKDNYLILSAPYIYPASFDNTLLGHFHDMCNNIQKDSKLEPLLYQTPKEAQISKDWLTTNKIGRYILMETNFSSEQSYWNWECTEKAIKLLGTKGYTVLLTHREDSKLERYNQHCRTLCLDFNYRTMPTFYNNASGFIGVSSGISCVVHTHECRKDIPHLEFVRGEHWCTRHYHKEKKVISFNLKLLQPLIEEYIK
jgi:ADP-heptose:LPS heptosyltransferase